MSYPAIYCGYDFVKSGTYRGFTIDGQEANLSSYREYNHGDRVIIITELSWFTGKVKLSNYRPGQAVRTPRG
jgi:hypothetical protein